MDTDERRKTTKEEKNRNIHVENFHIGFSGALMMWEPMTNITNPQRMPWLGVAKAAKTRYSNMEQG
jgi:hypothetical protein